MHLGPLASGLHLPSTSEDYGDRERSYGLAKCDVLRQCYGVLLCVDW
jgi:hypothetical protein